MELSIPLTTLAASTLASSTQAISSCIKLLNQGIKPSLSLPLHSDWIRCLKVHKNLLLSGSKDLSVKVTNLITGQELFSHTSHQRWIFSVFFSIDGTKILSGSGDGVLKVFSISPRLEELFSSAIHKGTLSCISTTDRYIVTGSFDNTIKILNNETYEIVNSFEAHKEPIYCLVTNQSGNLIYSGSRDKTIKIWNSYDIENVGTLQGHGHWIYTICLTPNEEFLVSGSEDRTVRIWNLALLNEYACLSGYSYTVTTVLVTPDSKYIVSGSDSIMKVWDFENKIETFTLECHKDYIRGLTCTEDGKFVITGGDDGLAKLWRFDKKSPDKIYHSHESIVSCLCVNENILVSGSDDKKVHIWDLNTDTIIWTFTGHGGRIFSVGLSPDNHFAFSSSDDCTIRKLSILEKREEAIIKGHVMWIRKIVYTPTGIYSGSNDNFVYFTPFDTNVPAKLNEVHTKPIYSLALSPENEYLASGSSDKTIAIWSIFGNNNIKRLYGHSDTVTALGFLNLDTLISASNDKTIKIWKYLDELESFSLTGHSGFIDDLYFLEGKVVTVSVDSSVKVWDIEERCEDYEILLEDKNGKSVVTTGNFIVVGTTDGGIEFFSVEEQKDFDIVKSEFQSPFDYLAAFGAYEASIIGQNNSQLSLSFSKYHFSLLHIYSFLGDEVKLKQVLERKVKFRKDKFNKSPFFYALFKKSQPCVDLLENFLIEQSEDLGYFYQASYAIRDDFNDLIDNGSVYLPTLLSNLMLFECKKFGAVNGNLPIIVFSDLQRISMSPHLIQDNEIEKKEVLIETKTSAFELPCIIGSPESIALQKSLNDSSNKGIYKSELVQLYIKEKWNRMFFWLVLYTILLWSNICLIVIVIILDSSIYTLIPIIVINIILLIFEIIQLSYCGFYEYFRTSWNLIDQLRLILTFVWILLVYLNVKVSFLVWLMVIINAVKGLIGFRIFDKTRFYVRLIIRSFQDIFFFMIIFFYSTMAFGVLFSSTKKLEGDSPFYNLWMVSFDMNLGNFEPHSEFQLDYLSFLMASIVNVIVLLSLLISILSDSFDKFLIEAKEIDYIEMADFIYEIELLITWNSGPGTKKFLHVLETREASITWEGSIKEIKAAMNNIEKNVKVLRDEIKNNNAIMMETFNKTLEAKFREITNLQKKIRDTLNQKKYQLLN